MTVPSHPRSSRSKKRSNNNNGIVVHHSSSFEETDDDNHSNSQQQRAQQHEVQPSRKRRRRRYLVHYFLFVLFFSLCSILLLHSRQQVTLLDGESFLFNEFVISKEDSQNHGQSSRPNVLFIMCDDLNDYIETLGGHSQVKTPNIRKLIERSVSFTQAHSNIPLCKPSRWSMLTGLYPHTSKYIHANVANGDPYHFVGLKHQRTILTHFRRHNYITMGTGKIFDGEYYDKENSNSHHFWHRIGEPSNDYGPFIYNKTEEAKLLLKQKNKNDYDEMDELENYPHPFVPKPFANHGPIRGSFGPLQDLSSQYPDLGWRTGDYQTFGFRNIRFFGGGNQANNNNDNSTTDFATVPHRDPTTDEFSAIWAIEQLQSMEKAHNKNANHEKNSTQRPFFLAVGFVRPHHPMIVDSKYFEMYEPLDELELPPSFKLNDGKDTFRKTLSKIGVGQRLYRDLIKSFNTTTTSNNQQQDDDDNNTTTIFALRKYLQAYLASVTAVDDLIGQVIDELDSLPTIRKNTIIVFTSDHGYQMGQKEYLGKNLLWQSSTRIPLVVYIPPGLNTKNTSTKRKRKRKRKPVVVDDPVSLIDLYPTLIDLCQLNNDTRKNPMKGKFFDGYSLKPFLENHNSKNITSWNGPKFALSTLSEMLEKKDYNLRNNSFDPSLLTMGMSLTLRYKNWRYIRYNNGKEELYYTKIDPYEWNNLLVQQNNTTNDYNLNGILNKVRLDLFQILRASTISSDSSSSGTIDQEELLSILKQKQEDDGLVV